MNLFIETAQYVPEVSQAAGARIVIHNQGEMPFPDEDGINLVPGFSTSVGVRRVLIIVMKKEHNSYLGPIYTICTITLQGICIYASLNTITNTMAKL